MSFNKFGKKLLAIETKLLIVLKDVLNIFLPHKLIHAFLKPLV